MATEADLHRTLDAWLARFRRRRALQWTMRGIWFGAAVAVLLLIYTYITRELLREEAILGGILAVLGGGFAAGLAGFFWPINRLSLARRFDARFGLKERVSTALEQEAAGRKDNLSRAQLEDAIRYAQGVDLASQLPYRLPGKDLIAVIGLLALSAGLIYFGEDVFRAAVEKRQIAQTIAQQAEELEALIEAIETDPDLSEEQKIALTEPLEQALEELDEAESLEEAYAALDEAAQELQALQDPEAESLAENLQQAGEEIARADSGPLESTAEALAEGDLRQAADELRSLDPSSIDPEDRERVAEQLERLADQAAGADPELEEALREAADAVRNGDDASAEEALEQAAQELEDLAQQQAASQAAEEAGAQVQQGQQEIVSAGQDAGQPQASGGGTSEGEDGGNNSGEGEGAGAGSGEGGGAEDSPGTQAGEDPISQSNSPDGSGETDYQPITPSSIGGEGGDWITVPPSGQEGDNVIGEGPSDPGNTAPVRVPYLEALPQYQQAASEAIDSGAVPPQYQDLVRDYFSSLEP